MLTRLLAQFSFASNAGGVSNAGKAMGRTRSPEWRGYPAKWHPGPTRKKLYLGQMWCHVFIASEKKGGPSDGHVGQQQQLRESARNCMGYNGRENKDRCMNVEGFSIRKK